MPPRPRKKDILSRMGREMKRAERRVLVGWIRFAKKHRHSNRLPVVLFALLFIDGFVFIVPSMLCLVGAVTISPKRWWLFAGLFVIAVAMNNCLTYYIGRTIPLDELMEWIKWASIDGIWEAAKEAIRDYGKFATFIGALFGLPTQMITMIIGAADRHIHLLAPAHRTTMFAAVGFGALGHAIKVFLICGLVRYGWVKLERKIEKDEIFKAS